MEISEHGKSGTHFLETDREVSQNIKHMWLSKGHPLLGPREFQMVKLWYRQQQESLTFWRVQTDKQVRTWKKFKQVRSTHKLESMDEQTIQNMKQMQAGKGLTSYRVKTDRQVRYEKNAKQWAPTGWRTPDGYTSQSMNRIWPSEGHSLSNKWRWSDESGYRKNVSKWGVLTDWRV